MDGQHQYEINLKKDGLFINLSSDDVYFISKQMDKWFRILLDDSYIPVSLAKPQPAPQAAPEPAFIPTHEATLMPTTAPQPAPGAPMPLAEPSQPVPAQTVPVYEQPPMPAQPQPQPVAYPQPQYQMPPQAAPQPQEYQQAYQQPQPQPVPQPAFVQAAPQPTVQQPTPQPMVAQVAQAPIAPVPAYAEAQAPAAPQYQQPYPPQPQAPMPPVMPMPQLEPVAIQQPQQMATQPAPAVYPQAPAEAAQYPEVPSAAPAPLDPAVKDDFEAMMDSLMKDFETEDSAAPTATAVMVPNGNGNGRTENHAEPAPIYSLADLCDRSHAGSSEDYLLLSAYYLTRFEQLEKFSLKRINSMLVKSGLTPVNHSVLETTLTRGYLSMVSDLTGMADVSEYMLTSDGEQAASRLL
ncbi:MAG TPA: hypothetical protein V6C52_10195 [Coleofasciculaceae cyanobacterium]|jgi:hypothetical protein